jgi:hypothetical protein
MHMGAEESLVIFWCLRIRCCPLILVSDSCTDILLRWPLQIYRSIEPTLLRYGWRLFFTVRSYLFVAVMYPAYLSSCSPKGMNIVLFGSYLFVSRYKRKQPKLNRRIMATAICMFLFSTTHVSLGFQRLIEGFVVLRNQPGGPAAFFSDVSIPANVAKICIHTINASHLFCTILSYEADCTVVRL